MTPSTSAAVNGWSGFDGPKPLASWYAEGLCDGLGDRLAMFDNSGTPSLELLRSRPMLASVIAFEESLRRRVDELRSFDHPAFSRIRAVERMESGDLALVSTFTKGKRVAEIFWSPEARTGVHPAFAAWLIREVTSGVAELHRRGGDIAHAAVSPDHIVLTPDGHVVIVEHVLGAALDRVCLPVGRLRQLLGLVAGEHDDGRARLDQRTDVIQIGWTALSLLLGRRLSPLDYPHRVDRLVDEFVATAKGRSPSLVSAVRWWLERALQMTPDAFESAIDAEDRLGELRVHGGPHTVAFGARSSVHQLGFELPPLPPMRSMDENGGSDGHDTEAPGSGSPKMHAKTAAPALATDTFSSPARQRAQAPHKRAALWRPRSTTIPWLIGAAFALIALAEGAWIARLGIARPAVAASVPMPIVLDSLQSGDAVVVDGREVGVTPLTLTLSDRVRSIRVQARSTEAPIELHAAAPAAAEPTATSAAPALAAARETRRGGVRVSSPIELQVLEGERVLGSTEEGPVVTTAGRHELDFVNNALGYRSRQVVEVRAGQIIPLKITPPDGRLSVNAVPWAQVLINGSPVGETPLANLPLAVGEHAIVFRHPQLGEQIQKVIVKSNALTRVSATFAR